jgi:hypothetical protein
MTLKFILPILLILPSLAFASEQINENCYRWQGVLVCGESIQPQKEVPQVEPKKDDAPLIVKTYWEDEKEYSNQEICNAIYIIEGKEKARQPFGIEGINCKTFSKCEQICLNTVMNKRKAWNQEGDFLEYLAKKYCPPNHVIWLKNLKYFLNKNS